MQAMDSSAERLENAFNQPGYSNDTDTLLTKYEAALIKATENVASLRRNIEFVQRVLEHNQDCIKVLDLEGRLLYMNSGGQRLMEIDDFDSGPKHAIWVDFWQGEAHDAAKAAFKAALDGETGRFDGICATAKGTLKWWEVVVTPMFNEDGEVQEILSASRDITRRKKAELALQAQNKELDQFASVVSHDLKAPLRGISKLCEWITEDISDDIPEETQQHLMLMQQRVGRMYELVDGLLQYARTGREQVDQETVQLPDLIHEVLDSISPPETFCINCEATALSLVTKRLLLTQVFSNLLSNAVKHHHKSDGKIQVSWKEQDTHYEFAIADDGPGIPEKDRDRVFDLFQTGLPGDGTTNNTGIGLPLIKKIVETEGGRFWLDESVKTGCTFRFTWPKSASEEA